MARSRKSAKNAGTAFETLTANYLREALNNDNIERLRTNGANDRGDIGNVRLPNGELVAVECKDLGGKYEIGPWLNEVETERINYNAVAGVVVAKRRGHGRPEDQVVVMTLKDLAVLIRGEG